MVILLRELQEILEIGHDLPQTLSKIRKCVYPEDGGSMFVLNVGYPPTMLHVVLMMKQCVTLLPDNTVSIL
jgi:hypothetical protein